MSGRSYITAIFEAEPSKLQDLKRLLSKQVQDVWDHEKDTCSRFEMTVDLANPNKFVLIESYSSEKDAKEHAQTSHFKEFSAQMQSQGVLAAPTIVVYSNGVSGFVDRQEGLYKA